MKFRPVFDFILVDPIADENVTKEGIILPTDAMEKPTKGRIVAVGKDVTAFSEGQVIVHGKYAGSLITLGEHVYKIMRQSEAMGFFEE